MKYLPNGTCFFNKSFTNRKIITQGIYNSELPDYMITPYCELQVFSLSTKKQKTSVFKIPIPKGLLNSNWDTVYVLNYCVVPVY